MSLREKRSSGMRANMAPRIAPPSLWKGRKPPGGKWPNSAQADDAETEGVQGRARDGGKPESKT